jgi:hypothetical protein
LLVLALALSDDIAMPGLKAHRNLSGVHGERGDEQNKN